MKPLSLTVPLGDGETATSFASRLAERNGSRYVQDFVQDMGLTWRAIIAGEADTLAELAALGGVDSARLVGHAIRVHDEYRRRIGQEIVPRRILRHIRQHVCPLCVAETGMLVSGGPFTWQLEPLRCCLEHGIALVALREVEPPRSLYDLAGRVHDDRVLLREARQKPQKVTIGCFDRYVADRLRYGPRGDSWLDGARLDVLWRVCETFGIVLMYGPVARINHLAPMQLVVAATAGFDAIGATKMDFEAALRSVHRHSKGERGGFYSEFRPLARWLDKLDGAPGFADIVETVRDFAEETYPAEPGGSIFGRPCRRLRVHSVSSAARAYGTNTTRMQRLVEAIAATPGHLGLPAPMRHLWFDAQAWDPFLRRYSRALNIKAAAAILGLHWDMFTQLIEAGWIDPVASFPGLVDRYDPHDLQIILDGLFRRSRPLQSIDADMSPILRACPKCSCDALTILGLVRDDRLTFVGRLPDIHGIPGLVIRPHEVRELMANPKVRGYIHNDLRHLLGANSSTISLLMRTGLIGYEMGQNPRTNRPMRVVTQEALDAFLAEFVTLSQIAQRKGALPKHAADMLARRDVHPIDMPLRCSKVYRRADVDRT